MKQMGLLSEDAGQNPNDRPAEEPSIRGRIAPIKERILFLRVPVDVAVDPDLPLFVLSEGLEQLFDRGHLGLEVQVRVDPLPVQVHACN
jgi:hypothetical protein